MLALGGDVRRVIDGPFVTIDRFIRYASRIPGIAEGARPIVVLTRTIPLAMAVLNARRKIELAVPALQQATWAIFVDPAEDPFFEAAAHKIGLLSDRLSDAPIWMGPGDASFLILSPQVREMSVLRQRAEELSAIPPPASSPRSGPISREAPPASHAHPPPPRAPGQAPQPPPLPPRGRPSGTLPSQPGWNRPAAQPAQAPMSPPARAPWPWKPNKS